FTYTIMFQDNNGYPGPVDSVVVLVEDVPIIIQQPADSYFVVETSLLSLSWTLSDRRDPGSYTILRNSAPLSGFINVPWLNDTAFSIPVDTNIGSGLYIYELRFWDSNGINGIPDIINVTVDDIPSISSSVISSTLVMQNTTGNTINWTLSDSSGGGNYTVYLNGTPYSTFVNQNWSSGVTVSVDIDSNIGWGWFNYSIRYEDLNGFEGLGDSFNVLIEDIPRVTVRPNASLTLAEFSTHDLFWILADNVGPGSYTVRRNGIPVVSYVNVPWYVGIPITVSVDTNTGFGLYIYTLEFNDSYGIYGVTDAINVTVDDIPVIIGNLSVNTVMLTDLPINLNWILQDSSGGGTYTILLDGTLLAYNITWTSGVPVSVPFNPSTPGMKNITLFFQDLNGYLGNTSNYNILVDEVPSLLIPPYAMSIERNQENVYLNWTIYDRGDGSGTYLLYRNSQQIASGSWFSGVSNSILLDTDLAPGEYEFSLYYMDSNSNIGVPSSIIITVGSSSDYNNPITQFFTGGWGVLLIIGIGIMVLIISVALIQSKKIKKNALTQMKNLQDMDDSDETPPSRIERNLNDLIVPSQKVEEKTDSMLHKNKPNFFCKDCKKAYLIKGADPSRQYLCKECYQPLHWFASCPNCSKKLAIKPEIFSKWYNKRISCPKCKEQFILQ
ncbi:MAG: hypothetical protein ACFFCS_23690, partial [Candidatus Hodarchaeota archaeon]